MEELTVLLSGFYGTLRYTAFFVFQRATFVALQASSGLMRIALTMQGFTRKEI
jgi:hypothetical protein